MPGYCFAATVCVHIKQPMPVCNGIGCFCFGVIMLRLPTIAILFSGARPSASKAENAQARLYLLLPHHHNNPRRNHRRPQSSYPKARRQTYDKQHQPHARQRRRQPYRRARLASALALGRAGRRGRPQARPARRAAGCRIWAAGLAELRRTLRATICIARIMRHDAHSPCALVKRGLRF